MTLPIADGASWALKAGVSLLAMQASTAHGRQLQAHKSPPPPPPLPPAAHAPAPAPAWAPAPPLPAPGACPTANSTQAVANNYVARMGQALEQAAAHRGSLNATEIAAAFSQLGAGLGNLWCGSPAPAPAPSPQASSAPATQPQGTVRYVPEFIPLYGLYFGNPAVTGVSACYIDEDETIVATPGQISPVDEETQAEEDTEKPATVSQSSPTTPAEEEEETPSAPSKPSTPTTPAEEETPSTPTEEETPSAPVEETEETTEEFEGR